MADMALGITGGAHGHHRHQQGSGDHPKPVRDLPGITTGTAVEFRLEADGRVVLTRADGKRRPASRFARLRGAAGKGLSTDQIMRLTRGEE